MMRNRDQHLSDEELLLAADNEFRWRSAKVRSHLENCAQCRSRADEFERVMEHLAQAQKNSLDPEVPSIANSRAALRARMADVNASESRLRPRLLAVSFGFAALMAVLAVPGVLVLRHSDLRNDSTSLISSNRNVLPNRDLTPGAVRRASLQEICALPREQVVKDVSPSQRQTVLEEYGISAARGDDYEVDYLITPGLGGDDKIQNLWPEPYHAATWNAHVKDALEERLHEMVCAQQLDLAVAQKAIATDWIAAYEKYMRTAPAKS